MEGLVMLVTPVCAGANRIILPRASLTLVNPTSCNGLEVGWLVQEHMGVLGELSQFFIGLGRSTWCV